MKQNSLRERFEHIRNQHNGIGLRVRLTFVVTLELFLCIACAFGADALIKTIFHGFDIPLWVDFIVISTLIGIFATMVLSRAFFDPIKKLRKAIEQVADGDFSVQLETKSTSKEIKEIFSGFNLMTHELSSIEILQSDFVSNVSHEFKTPINAIEGYSMLLQNGDNLTQEQLLYVDKIVFNTKRLSTLVGSILLLSKLENQSIHQKDTKFQIDEQIRQAIVELEALWDKKEIEFEAELDSVLFCGQEMLLHHVWSNLISNAIKFSPQGGRVFLSLRNDGDRIVFTISDQGCGLSEDDKKHVFDKFYQGDTSHKEDGNGLGLALAKKIVSLEGGTISADNMPEGGAVFTVILPKSPS